MAALLLWLVNMAFRAVNDTSVVAALFTVAKDTYGLALGLVWVGMFFATWAPRIVVHSLGVPSQRRFSDASEPIGDGGLGLQRFGFALASPVTVTHHGCRFGLDFL